MAVAEFIGSHNHSAVAAVFWAEGKIPQRKGGKRRNWNEKLRSNEISPVQKQKATVVLLSAAFLICLLPKGSVTKNFPGKD